MRQLGAEEFLGNDSIIESGAFSGPYREFGKRIYDTLVAIALIPIVGPVILLLAVVVWAGDGGRPFFGHVRVGRGGRLFRCWKLRTMVPDAENRLADHLAVDTEAAAEWALYRKLSADPRVTRTGDFLRRTSLDELPQLWNVLKGDMSFVGPRPVTPDELDLYGAARTAYCAVRPGITGLWQVSGRNEVTYDERVALDGVYLRRISLPTDVAIMLRTARVIVQPTGR